MKTTLSSIAISFAIFAFTGCKMSNALNDSSKDNYSLDFMQKNNSQQESSEDQINSSDKVHSPSNEISTAEKKLLSKKQSSKDTAKKEKIAAKYEKFLDANADVEQKVSFNFESATIAEIAATFCEILGVDYLIDPEVVGSVTMGCSIPMSKRQMWELFERTVSFSGGYFHIENNIVHILPSSRVARNQSVQAKFFPLQYASANLIADKIVPTITAGALIIKSEINNGMLILDSETNLNKIEEIIRILDTNHRANWPMVIIPCQNVSSLRLAKELEGILPIIGFPVNTIYQTPGLNTNTSNNANNRAMINMQNRNPATKTADTGNVQMVSLDRVQVLIVSAANQEAIDEVKHWANILDRQDIGEQENLFVYKVANSKSEELLEFLKTMFVVTENSTVGEQENKLTSSSSGGGRTSTSPTTNNNRNTTNNNNNNATNAVDSNGAVSIFDVPMKVIADATQNRLVIRTTPRAYDTARALLQRLDTPPLQVLFEVIISEVTLTKNTEFGINFSNASGAIGSTDIAWGDAFNGVDSLKNGAFAVFTRGDKMATLKALAGEGEIEVLSRPHLVVRNNQVAKIQVGDRVPIISGEITNGSSGSSSDLTRTYQYQDTGTILQILPRVTDAGLITFDLIQEISDVSTTITSGIDSPTITTREIQTSMQMKNGNTAFVGGLIRNSKDNQFDSVPLIGKIPLIGRLFGYTRNTNKKTELVMMITGTVIIPENGCDAVIRRYSEAVRLINENLDEEKEKIKKQNAQMAARKLANEKQQEIVAKSESEETSK